MKPRHILLMTALAAATVSCNSKKATETDTAKTAAAQPDDEIQQKLDTVIQRHRKEIDTAVKLSKKTKTARNNV